MGIIKNIINAITGKDEKEKEKKTETKKATAQKITTAGPVNTEKTPVWGAGQKTSAPVKTTPAKTAKKTAPAKAPARITASDIVTPVKTSKQEKKLSQSKGPVASFDVNETFIERAKKQGTAKDKERAERMQQVLYKNKNKGFDSLSQASKLNSLDKAEVERYRKTKAEALKDPDSAWYKETVKDRFHLDEDRYGTDVNRELNELTSGINNKNIRKNITGELTEDEKYIYAGYLDYEINHVRDAHDIGEVNEYGFAPSQFMSEDEINNYMYLRGKYGENIADLYYLKTDAYHKHYKETDNARTNANLYKRVKENPTIGYIAIPTLTAAASIMGLIDLTEKTVNKLGGNMNIVKGAVAKEDPRELVRQAVADSTDNKVLKKVHEAGLELAEEVGEGLLGGEVIGGFTSGYTSKQAELAQYGVAPDDTDAFTASLVSGLMNSYDFGATKALGKVFGKAMPKRMAGGALKTFIGNTVGSVFSGAGVQASRAVIDDIADATILKGKGRYAALKEQYKSYGFSDEAAKKKAAYDAYVTPVINSAVMGAVFGGITSVPDTVATAVDFTVRGKAFKNDFYSKLGINKETFEGLTDAEAERARSEIEHSLEKAVVKLGTKYDKNSAAAKNAEALQRRLDKGKGLTASQIGAQELLNGIEAYKFISKGQRLEQLTGVKVELDSKLPSGKEGQYGNGVIKLTDTPGDDLSSTLSHEVGHLLEDKSEAIYSLYVELLQDNTQYSVVRNKMESLYAKKGKEANDKLLDSEASAELTRYALPKTAEDYERLIRRVENNPTFHDKLYNSIRDLRIKMYAKNGKVFADKDTGFSVRYSELLKMEKTLEDALVSVRGSKGRNIEGVRYSISQSFSSQVDDVLDNKMNTGYKAYLGTVSKLLAKCGFDDSLPLLISQGHIRDIVHPKSETNSHWHGIDKDIVKQIPTLIKEPVMIYDSISEDRANTVCIVTSKKDSDGLPIIIAVKANSAENVKYIDVEIQKANKSNYVASMYGRSGFSEHLKRIIENDALLYANKKKTQKLLSDRELQLLSRLSNFGFDKIIHQSKNIVKTKKENNSVKYRLKTTSDEAKYGRDIEGGIRALEIDGLKELDVVECAERIRRAVDEITSAMDEAIVKSGITDTAVNKFDELTKDLIDTEAKRLMERGYTADEAEDIAMHMYYELYEATESRVNRYVTEANDLIAKTYGRDFNPETDDPDAPPTQPKFDIYKDKKEETVNNAKAQRDRATEAKKKISSLFENTAKKDFFEGTESELNSRIDEFMYDAVRNRDTAEAATEYVKEKGTTAVYRELATMTGGVTAFDTAKAWALAVEFRKRINDPATSPEAKTRYSQLMVDVLAIMREKWTEAGQATQAIKLFNLLTLEGQLMEFKRRADAGVEAQLRKRPDYEKIKAEEAVAKKKDRARKAAESEQGSPVQGELAAEQTEGLSNKKPRKKQEKTPQSELEKLYKKYGITYIPEETFRYAQDTLKAIDDAVNANSLNDVIDIIMQNSRRRKTNTSKRLPGKLRRYYESETKLAGGDSTKPFEVLANTARQQVFAMIDDALPKSVGRKWSSVQAMGMLDNPMTFLRNIASNFFLTPAETITNNLAVLSDLFMRIITGRRTLNFELPGGYINAYRRMRKAALEQNLKVNTFIDSEGGYTGKTNRVFTSKVMSKLEELTGYNLAVSDETQKGIIEARVEHSLKYLIEHGHLTEDEAIEIIAKEIKYRTFQDDTLLGKWLDGIKTAFNFKKDFGLGDIVVKFTKVPGAVITRNLEYSPAGYLKFVWTLGKTAINMAKQRRKPSEMTATEQRDIALTLARPTTSLGIIATGALLASKGIIVGSDITDTEEDEEENYALNKFRQATGVQGYKLNWDALCRFLNGEETEIRNNDRLFEMSWMPFAPQFLTGAVMQEEAGYDFDGFKDGALDWFSVVGDLVDLKTLPKTLGATVDYSLEQLSGLPALQGIRDIFENWEYKTGYVDFAAQTATDAGLSFIPQIVKRLGYAIDPKTRDPYHAEGTIERAWQKIEANLPFMALRDNVPEKIDVFGEPVSGTLGSWWKDVLNEVISPGRVSRFEENGITQELDILYKYNSDALLTTPRTTGNIAEVEGRTVRFNLYGEDYEEYSEWLGTTTMRNITELMKSDYYKYLPYYQRANAVAQIKKESEEACRTAWAEKLCEADDATQNEILEAGLEGYRDMAKNLVYINQATEHLKSDGVRVETVVDCYYQREFTQEELKEEISAAEAEVKQHEKILKKLHAGNGYKMVDAGNGKTKRKYTREMTPEEKAFTIRERENEIEKAKQKVEDLKAGRILAKVDIVGKWSDLPKEHQKIVLEQISKYPDETVYIPDELMEPENLVDFSDAEPPEDEDIIDITDGYSREKLITGEKSGTVTAKTSTQTTGNSSTGSRSGRSGSSHSGGSGAISTIAQGDIAQRAGIATGTVFSLYDVPTGDEAFPEISPFQKPFRFPAPFKNNKSPFIFPFKKG